jgi:iron complex outermembrane receptor protein
MPAQKITKPRARHGVCLIALLTVSHQATAQLSEPVSEKDFLTEMPIVLSVSRLPQRLDETPGAVTILDRDMIRLSGARDVADLLRLVPGFQTSTSFETTAPLASYHGSFDSYSNHIQVLVDGRSAYSTFFIGSVGAGLQTVALADIERIEVLRGSNSAAYGARAMLGVINIVTRHTVDTLGLQATLTAGENGVRDAQARFGWGVEDASFRLSADQRGDDGLAGANGRNQVSRVNFRADLRNPARDDVQLRAGGLEIDAGKGYAGNVGDPLRNIFLGSSYAQLDWRRSLGEDEDLAFSLSHTQETYRDRFPYSLGRLGGIFIDGSGRSNNDSASLQHTFRQGAALRVVWGGEFRREQVTARELYNTDAALVTDFTRLFGNAEWRLAQDLILNAGAMAEKSSVNGSSIAPRLMLNWHAAPGQTLRAGVSRAHRPPSTFEQFANVRYSLNGVVLRTDFLTRGPIQPERVFVRELGYLGDFPTLGASLDVRAFHERITGFVRRQQYALPAGTTLFPSNPFEYVNAEDFSLHGLEYQLKWRPWRDAQLIFNQAYTRNSSVYPRTARAAPKLASSITFFQKLPGGLDLSLMHQDSGQDSGWDGQTLIKRTDLRLGLPLRFGVNRGELALVVQNLGAPYYDHSPNFEFQRRAFVSLRIEN